MSEPPYCCQDDEPEAAGGGVKSLLWAALPSPEFQPPFEPAVGSEPELPPSEPEAPAPKPLCWGEAMKLIPDELPEPPCPLLSELGVIVALPPLGSVAEPLMPALAFAPPANGAIRRLVGRLSLGGGEEGGPAEPLTRRVDAVVRPPNVTMRLARAEGVVRPSHVPYFRLILCTSHAPGRRLIPAPPRRLHEGRVIPGLFVVCG